MHLRVVTTTAHYIQLLFLFVYWTNERQRYRERERPQAQDIVGSAAAGQANIAAKLPAWAPLGASTCSSFVPCIRVYFDTQMIRPNTRCMYTSFGASQTDVSAHLVSVIDLMYNRARARVNNETLLWLALRCESAIVLCVSMASRMSYIYLNYITKSCWCFWCNAVDVTLLLERNAIIIYRCSSAGCCCWSMAWHASRIFGSAVCVYYSMVCLFNYDYAS